MHRRADAVPAAGTVPVEPAEAAGGTGTVAVMVRRALLTDAAAVLQLIRNTPSLPQWEASALAIPAQPDASHAGVAHVLPLLAPAPSTPALTGEGTSGETQMLLRQLLVAEVNGSFAGFAQWSALLGEAELEGMAVLPEQRRGGVGRALLRQVLANCRGAGAGVLRLEVRAGNEPAVALYRSEGFALVGRRAGYYAQPAEDALLLEWNLPR